MLCKNKLKKKYMTSEVRFRVFHNLFKILVAPQCVGLRVIHFLTILKNENYFISQTNHFAFFKKMKNES